MRYLVILLAVAFMGCKAGTNPHEGHDHETEGHGHGADSGHGHIIFTHEQAEAAGLEAETIEPSEFGSVIKTGGQIVGAPIGTATITATSSGIVTFTRPLTEGAAVAKGQTIATISSRGFVDGDPAARAKIELETAERNYRRAEALAVDNIVSQKDLDEARQRYESARTANTSGAAISPIAGYIATILVDQGEYAAAGQAIATVVDNTKMHLRAEVPERYFAALPEITTANFKTPYDDTVRHAGKLLSYGKSAEGGYIPVTFECGGAAAGSYVEVWLSAAPRHGILSIPRTALSEEQGLYFVYTRHGDDEYFKQEVAPGADNGQRIEIISGLEPGSVVVTRGVTQLRLASTTAVIPHGHSH